MTSASLRVLIVEDSGDDVELILIALRRGSWNVTHARVNTHAAMALALDKGEWDLIIADYSMPDFSGPAALALAMERTSGVPFILISGVVSEETAVQAMKAGADDYFSKGNFARLVPAVRRELHKAESSRCARALERQLRERESHLAHALQLARVGTWHLDIRTSTAVWSDEACRIVGLDPRHTATAFGELMERLTSKDRAALMEILRHPAAKPFAQDLELVRDDGMAQFVHIRGDIVRDANQWALEAAGTIQDITERKLVEAEVERAHLQLAGQNQRLVALTQQAHGFVDDVSHEFRTPLTVIKEFGAIIADGLAGPVSAEQSEYLGIMDNAVLDLNQLVEDFLDSSKLRAGRLRVNRRPQRISEIFTRIRPGLQRKALSRSITVVETIDADLPLVFADEEKVRRVIMNLATNAVKFSPEGSQIELWARTASEGGVVVGVSDHGRGLAPSDLKQLFERFRQLPSSQAPSVKGFGLGLNIARQLVWLNLGHMSVVSDPPRGSTFSFTLPGVEPAMILERFLARLAECEVSAQSLGVITVTHAGTAQAADASRLFLAATTRPTDLVLEMPLHGRRGFVVIGPTQSSEGWVSRLSRTHARAVADAGADKLGSLEFEIQGRFEYPADALAAHACVLEHLALEVALV